MLAFLEERTNVTRYPARHRRRELDDDGPGAPDRDEGMRGREAHDLLQIVRGGNVVIVEPDKEFAARLAEREAARGREARRGSADDPGPRRADRVELRFGALGEWGLGGRVDEDVLAVPTFGDVQRFDAFHHPPEGRGVRVAGAGEDREGWHAGHEVTATTFTTGAQGAQGTARG